MIDIPRVEVDFGEPPGVPEAAILRVNELLKTARLHRYGEFEAGESDVADLEAAFAEFTGRRYCVAFNSCGAAMAAGLMAIGVERGEPVLMNAFTLAPVPGAIAHSGGKPIFVGIKPNYEIDLDHLRILAKQTNARLLLLSHMRGHICDMHKLCETATELGLTVIEDCAHTMGARWDGRPTGTFGTIGCFSTQSFKHINSGEGGLLITDDDDVAARAILLSGPYMLYGQHGTVPPRSTINRHRYLTPNLSMRMSAITAAIARPQLDLLESRAKTWNERYKCLEGLLNDDPQITVPQRHAKEEYIGSSIQFSIRGIDAGAMIIWLALASGHGVAMKWFGHPEAHGYTSCFHHWRFATRQRPRIPSEGLLQHNLSHHLGEFPQLRTTSRVLLGLCDMRIPLSISLEDCELTAEIIRKTLAVTLQQFTLQEFT